MTNLWDFHVATCDLWLSGLPCTWGTTPSNRLKERASWHSCLILLFNMTNCCQFVKHSSASEACVVLPALPNWAKSLNHALGSQHTLVGRGWLRRLQPGKCSCSYSLVVFWELCIQAGLAGLRGDRHYPQPANWQPQGTFGWFRRQMEMSAAHQQGLRVQELAQWPPRRSHEAPTSPVSSRLRQQWF